jgi:hypothetical protein
MHNESGLQGNENAESEGNMADDYDVEDDDNAQSGEDSQSMDEDL